MAQQQETISKLTQMLFEKDSIIKKLEDKFDKQDLKIAALMQSINFTKSEFSTFKREILGKIGKLEEETVNLKDTSILNEIEFEFDEQEMSISKSEPEPPADDENI